MSTVVDVASSVNLQTNILDIFAVNTSRAFYGIQNSDLIPANAWQTLPVVPGAATPVSLTAVYRPQLNKTIVTVGMSDNTAYTMTSPFGAGANWVLLTSIPTA